VNYIVTRYEARRGRELQSDILLADAAHTRSDILVSLSVMGGLAAVYFGVYWLDAIVAFLVAALILYIAYGVLKRQFTVLTDTTSLPSPKIEQVVLEIPEVLSCSHIRSRGEPPNLFIDLEIQLDPDLPLWKAHRIAHVVMDRCRQRFGAADVVVHVEPPLAVQRSESVAYARVSEE
jgi:cation diffusion facilitator family transporter